MANQEPAPSGTVTFLFTDIEGSTKLAQEYPDAMPGLLARHNEILHHAVQSNNGHVFQVTGDAFCAAFRSAGDALRAAIDAQRSLQGEAWLPAAIKVRMGLHTGSATYQAGGDYEGYLTLTRAQRLMSAGHGGQVLISLATQELIQDEMPEGVSVWDMGQRRLKDLLRPEHIFQLVVPTLLADFPPIKTLDAYRHNLPAQITSFIGREKEISEIQEVLARHRLVTLTGSGGAGKTRLGLEVAAACLDRFPDGVWLAELATVGEPSLVMQTLLAVFGLREDHHRGASVVLIEYLREKSALLVLDNCEHLIGETARHADALLHACAGLRILATSREALGVAGEFAYRVPSLSAPDPQHLPPLDELHVMDSVRLFLERAAAAKPGFQLTEANASSIAQICSRLDGIPLAIELAASRVRMLSPEQIAARLDDRFRLLTGGSRTALPRQQTLRAMIDWSYSLLSDEEKILFRRLAVFAGGWTLEAAEAVCGAEDWSPSVLDVLTRLLDKSLLFTEESPDGVRYHRLETIRQYSREKLLETDEAEILRDRHRDFFVGFAEQADEELQGPNQIHWQSLIAAELDNIRAALEWALQTDPDSALRIAGSMNLFWTAGGFSAEGFGWTEQALRQIDETPRPDGTSEADRRLQRAKALRGMTRLYLSRGDNASARRAAEESVALYRQGDDQRGLAFALVILAYPLDFLGERAQAEAALHESYAIARSQADVYLMCRALNRLAHIIIDLYQDLDLAQGYLEESVRRASEAGLRSQQAQAIEILGLIATRRGDHTRARKLLEESRSIYAGIGASFNVTLETSNLAHLERQLGQYSKALEYYRETILAFRDIGQTGAVAHQLECFGFIAMAQQKPERAIQLFAAASNLRERSSTPMTPDEQSYFRDQVEVVRGRVEPLRFSAAWAQGSSMTMEQAIALALEPAEAPHAST